MSNIIEATVATLKLSNYNLTKDEINLLYELANKNIDIKDAVQKILNKYKN